MNGWGRQLVTGAMLGILRKPNVNISDRPMKVVQDIIWKKNIAEL